MRKTILIQLVVVLGSVFFLSVVWEFYLEPLVQEGEPESISERWEFVLTSLAFSCIALILPCRLLLKAGAKSDKTTEELISANEKISMLLLSAEKSLSSAVITDVNGNISYANPIFYKVTGYAPNEVIGCTLRILKSGRHRSKFYKNLWETLLAGKEWTGKICNKKKNGELYWEKQSITPIKDSNGKIINFLSIRIEDTERKMAEKQLKNYSKELTRSNKDLQRYANFASHDLQAPLRKIIAFSERIDGSLLKDEHRDFLARLQRTAMRMQTLLDDLLELSRLDSGKSQFEPTDLNHILDDVLDDLQAEIQDTQASITVESLPEIEANSTQMRQLLQNLVENALKYHREGEPPLLTIKGSLKNGQCEIRVEDNGIGFEEKHKDRIFQPLARLHGVSAYEGTGIGLSICQKVVNKHHGTISVKSCPDEGTTFTISLPEKQTTD